MDDFKPEDDMKADRNDRRAGRSRQSSERDADPQINFDDVDLDADEGRPTRAGKARREREEEEFEEELDAQDEEMLEEQPVERRPRKRKKAPAKPASRQYIMMGVGILVLLLLIVAEFIASLPLPAMDGTLRKRMKNTPVAGNAHLKTGTLNNGRALAGFTRDQHGNDWVMVAIINHPRASGASAVLDQLAQALYQDPAGVSSALQQP